MSRSTGASGSASAPRAAAPRGAGGRSPRSVDWRAHLPTLALVLLGVVLYARGLVLGLVGDDLTLLDAALRHPLGELLSGRHGILGYYRPVSRELYFWGWGRVLGLDAGGLHLVNALTFAAVVVMIDRLGRAWAGPLAGRLAAVSFLLFPPGSALLAWVSCAQDLIMLFWSLAAFLLYQKGRHALAGVATLLAALSKETAVVLPAALAVMDVVFDRRSPARARLARLAPGFAGTAVAIAVSVAVRTSWPAGAAVSIWSPAQFAGAWRLPFDFLRTVVPPDTGAGIAQALESQPVWLGLVGALAALALPGNLRAGARRVPARSESGGGRTAEPGIRPVVLFGLALLVLAMLPVGFVIERWRGYFFSLSAVGGALALGGLLAPLTPPLTRGLLAVAAIVNFAAGGIYRPLETAAGPARHPHVNYAFFRETGALTETLRAALEPWCASIRALPRTFVAGVPPSQAFETAIGPGLRIACRDTAARVRFLADFTPADARAEFGVLRFDPNTVRFQHERADARVRGRVGEGFLIHARFDVAAACFETAAAGRPDRDLSYPLAASLAAAARGDEARRAWREAQARGAVLEAEVLADRLARGPRPGAPGATPGADSAAVLVPLTRAVLREPWEAEPHRALGRALLDLGRGREATFELAVAAGIGRTNPDLAWLARGYEAMGLVDEALAAYGQALKTGLAGDFYRDTRDRFFALQRRTGAALDRPQTGP